MPRVPLLILIFSLVFLESCAVLSLMNSGSVNIKYQVSEATLQGIRYEEVARVTNPSFSIRNIQHPRAYGRWNFNFRITPSLHYDDTDYETGELEFNVVTNDFQKRRNINIKRGISMANAKFSLHTPLGAFTLTGGFGGTIYKMDDGGAINTIKTREIRRLDFTWTGFLSRRFFILVGPRYYKAGYESYVFAFRLGYFWGKIQKI